MVAHLLLLSRKVGSHGMIAYLCNHHLWSREFKMVVHLVLLSTCRLRNHAHLRSRDFKLTNKCVLSPDSFLLTTAVTNRECLNSAATTRFYVLKLVGEIKVHTQIYFFILKLKPLCSIQKTVKIKGCERPAYKFPSSYYSYNKQRIPRLSCNCQILLPKISRRNNDCFFTRASKDIRHSRK